MEEQGIIELLCSKGHRGSCTHEERWAAMEIHRLLEEIGLTPELQEFMGHRTFGEKLAVHMIPALVLSICAYMVRDLALLFSFLILLLAVSFSIESMWFVDVASRIFPRRGSVNVLAREEKKDAEKKILFVAHHDSQKKGQIFNPRLIELMKHRFSTTSRVTPIHLTFLGIIGLMVTSSGFAVDLPGIWQDVHLLAHGALLVWGLLTTGLVLEWTLSRVYVPGANDNASGVAVMVGLAEELSGKQQKAGTYENVEFWYLSTGCEETGLGGALAFIQEHGERVRDIPTSVLCLDGFGYGNLHYFTADGILLTRPYDSALINAAREVMTRESGSDRPFVCRVFTDGLAFSLRGFPAITFGSLDEESLVKNYHWHTDIPEHVDYRSVAEAKGFLRSYVERITQSG